jgi:hypothetical protein
MIPAPLSSDEFPGFENARAIMWCYETRVRTFSRMRETSFIEDLSIMAVHIENTIRADRVQLTAFDRTGSAVHSDTLFVDDASQRLDITPEFDHDFTRLLVPIGSDLAEIIKTETGWVANMAELRRYDLQQDLRQTQRAVLLAHLGDMMRNGDAKGFIFGQEDAA